MGKDVARNIIRIADGDAPIRPILGYFAVGHDPVHAVAHRVFEYEADITPCIENSDRVIAVGDFVLDVIRAFGEDGETLQEITYRMPTPDLLV
jgi:hypothetical protein